MGLDCGPGCINGKQHPVNLVSFFRSKEQNPIRNIFWFDMRCRQACFLVIAHMQPKYGPVGLLVSHCLYGYAKIMVLALWRLLEFGKARTIKPFHVHGLADVCNNTCLGRSVSESRGDCIDLPPGQTALHLMP